MTFQSRSLRYLHGGIVICVKGALRHSRESLANEELGKGRLGISNYCSQDVNGCLKKKNREVTSRRGSGTDPCQPHACYCSLQMSFTL